MIASGTGGTTGLKTYELLETLKILQTVSGLLGPLKSHNNTSKTTEKQNKHENLTKKLIQDHILKIFPRFS